MKREVGAGMTAYLGFLCAPVLSKSLLLEPEGAPDDTVY